ncbi:MAG: outer membrane beta-barrel protein [Saprospiraceae bacterium]|nr:outer membrane beta-barrel protein [Saprospiraceae bacterium]MCB9343508.1 outer membrane beta-barrel protein [Lewinellaceae bacterium]
MTKIQLFSALFIFFSLSLFSQNQFTVQAGVGSYSTPGTMTNSEVSDQGTVFLYESGNVPDFISGPSVVLGYQYHLTKRFGVGAQVSFMSANGTMDKEAFFSHSSNNAPSSTVSLAYKRSLYGVQTNALAWLNLMPKNAADLQLGAGIAHVYRSQNYRSFYTLDFDNQMQGHFFNETYTDESKNAIGLAFAAQISIPLTSHWQITGGGSANFYRNEDLFATLSAGVGYIW